MQDEQDASAGGRTNWLRFALAVAVPGAITGVVVVGMANGAIAAQLSVSGKPFKISADLLDGDGFVQYGRQVNDADGKPHFVATSGIAHAKLTNLCQSVKVPNAPISLVIRAGRDAKDPAIAENMLIDMTELRGKTTFTSINIGQDASTLQGGGPGAQGDKGSFGQQASHVVIDKLQQVSLFTSAGSFTLSGLELKVDVDGDPEECF